MTSTSARFVDRESKLMRYRSAAPTAAHCQAGGTWWHGMATASGAERARGDSASLIVGLRPWRACLLAGGLSQRGGYARGGSAMRDAGQADGLSAYRRAAR